MYPQTNSLVAALLTAVLTAAALPTPASAQTAPASSSAPKQTVLRLKDNTLLMGHIVREDATTVVFSAGPLGELTINKSEIAGELSPATVNAALQGRPRPPRHQATSARLRPLAP